MTKTKYIHTYIYVHTYINEVCCDERRLEETRERGPVLGGGAARARARERLYILRARGRLSFPHVLHTTTPSKELSL